MANDATIDTPLSPDWLAGLVSSRVGHFYVIGRNLRPVFTVEFERDERELLEKINKEFLGGLATITEDGARLRCDSTEALVNLGRIFDKHPPITSKKARDFRVWRKAVDASCNNGRA